MILSYACITAYMYVMQRSFLYFPAKEVVTPQNAGLPQASVVSLTTSDSETLQAWYIPARQNKPTILFFFGNGGRLQGYARRYAKLTENGNGLLAISYRGYGASTGHPTENGLIEDAETANRFLTTLKIPKSSTVLYADSLGTGVAIALAAKHKFAGIVLDSPFSSTVDVASWRFPFMPIRWLMSDQFRSDQRIAAVHAPLLIMHGTADGIVPIEFGKKLFGLANQPKQFIEVKESGHIVSGNPEILEKALNFISSLKLTP